MIKKAKIGFGSGFVLLSIVLILKGLVGCSNGSQGSNAAAVTSDTKDFLFVLNQGSSDLHPHAFNATTGAVGTAGTHTTTLAAPSGEALTPNGKFLYTTDTLNGVTTYSVDPTSGTLTLAFAGVSAGNAVGIAIDPQGRFLFASDPSNNVIYAFKISSSTGELTAANNISVSGGPSPSGLAVNPAGTFLYSANIVGSVSAYQINQTSGQVSAVGSNVSAGADTASLAITPNGSYLYAASQSASTVQAYSIDPSLGTLTPIGSGVSTGGTNAFAITTEASGKYVYVANEASADYRGFTIQNDGSIVAMGSGTVTLPGSTPNPTWVGTDPAGKFVYFMDSSNSTVDVYSLNTGNGVLTAVSGSPFSVCFNVITGIIGAIPQP